MRNDTKPDEAFDEGFQGISRSQLEAMNDLALAEWQSGWKPRTAKDILAEKEWQRRMFVRQLQEQFKLDSKLSEATNRAMQFAAIIGVLGTLAGAGVGAYATFKAGSAQISTSAGQPQTQSTPAKVPASSASK
ncbi:hypothetical protein [Acidovorax sp. NCPPB 3576]|uniref:hypothetical protein n=1 Tax=Acidovorax sp. NCPPB 3576 TaxID=2940488 RepID=UPI00234A5CB2|nr:hypothetical protein [Acidovorax sp. NCPPB 3576]WCM90637.1 hypothetical protein M5C98_11745 [Acidovorax sp. NCPPB 3576]